MIIKNFLTNDIELLEEFITKELCKYNINYVFIKETHEIHFDKYIFRFFNKKSILKVLQEYITLPTIEENTTGLDDFIQKQKLRPNYHNTNINKILKRNKITQNIKFKNKKIR